ncbi:MAG: DUF1800 family protein [Ilumatobacteraceae bacterium]
MADSSTLVRILRRLTFSHRRLDEFSGAEPAEVVARLLAEAPLDPEPPELGTDDDYSVLPRWWLEVMGRPDAGLHERMVWFWHGTFTSALSKAEPALMFRQHRLIRRLALGNFRDLAQELTIDGAMLDWLDGNWSTSESPNENFAREMMELFCLGIGQYTEADVKAGAYLFSGWHLDDDNGRAVVFDRSVGPQRSVEFLGGTASSATEAVDLICDHPACAPHVAGLVFSSFVGRAPSDDERARHAAAFRDSGLELGELVASVLNDPAFLAGPELRPRSAVEWFLATADLLDAPLEHWILDQLGQMPFDPPNVAGWPGPQRWTTAGSALARSVFGLDNAWDAPTLGSDPVADVLDRAAVEDPTGTLADELRRAVDGLDGRRDASTLLHALVIASPEFALC